MLRRPVPTHARLGDERDRSAPGGLAVNYSQVAAGRWNGEGGVRAELSEWETSSACFGSLTQLDVEGSTVCYQS